MRHVVALPIHAYRALVSPLLGARCKYHPSCSRYALDALEEYGVVRGARPRRLAASALQPVEPRRRRLRARPDALQGAPMRPAHPDREHPHRLLEWLHASVGLPWAWAIVVLTLIVRMVILPLTIKQIRSMQRLQVHAPELKAIQQKYKNDKHEDERGGHEVLPREQREPSRVVPPAPPPDPDLLRALLRPARTSRRRSSRTTRTPTSAGSTSSRTSPRTSTRTGRAGCSSSSTSAASSPRRTSCRRRWTRGSATIFLALPFLFIFFVINFPIGLMLYWSTTNLWTVGQGLVTRRLVPKPQPPPKRTSRTPPKAEAARLRHGAPRRRPAARRPSRPGAASSASAGARRRARGRGGERARKPRPRPTASSRARARPSARPSGRRCASSSGASPGSTRRASASRWSPRASAACSASARCRRA